MASVASVTSVPIKATTLKAEGNFSSNANLIIQYIVNTLMYGMLPLITPFLVEDKTRERLVRLLALHFINRPSQDLSLTGIVHI